MTDYSKFTDQEIDNAMAEFMGWRKGVKYWHPHDDLNQVWQCEEKIIGLHLDQKYYLNLERVSGGGGDNWIQTIHAAARQKCEAILMAVRDEKC